MSQATQRPDRDADVLRVLKRKGCWMTNKEIAKTLNTSGSTVRNNTSSLYDQGKIERCYDVRFPKRHLYRYNDEDDQC